MGSDVPKPIDHDTAFRTLVLRLLATGFPGAPAPEDLELLIGKLPEKLPVELPLPEGAHIVGSLVRGPWSSEIVLDVAHPRQSVFSFYREHLEAAGWKESDRITHPEKGFVPVDFAAWYRSPQGISLMVIARQMKNDSTDLRLVLEIRPAWTDATEPMTICELESRPSAPTDRPVPASPIPALSPPPNAEACLGTHSESSSLGDAESTIILATDLDSQALAWHYGQQLADARWTRRNEGRDGPLAWSTWSLSNQQGQGWGGVLLAVELPEAAQRRLVYLRVDPVP